MFVNKRDIPDRRSLLKNHVNRIFVILLLCTALSAARAGAETSPDETATDLMSLSIEDLMHVEVTSVSKKNQKLDEVAAAIYVITREDIRRSGVTSIPEALRLAPG